MRRFRDIKREARSKVHETFAVAALYIPVQGATPVPCTVRVHGKFAAIGQPPGGEEYATRTETEPKIIFNAVEVPAPRPQTGVVSVEAGEAYKIDHCDPVDDAGYITARVTHLPVAATTGLPVPAA